MEEYEQKEKSENVFSEPEIEYAIHVKPQSPFVSSDVIDIDLETELIEEEMDARLEAYFAEQRELIGDTPVPDGYQTIEEVYQESIKHLEDLYAKKKTHIKA